MGHNKNKTRTRTFWKAKGETKKRPKEAVDLWDGARVIFG